jgi:hypothetical protein
MAENHIIIVGGTSVNNATHDANPWNFINPAIRRGKALKTSVSVILYTPSYERRVANQKKEHSSVENPKKDPQYFANKVESVAKDNKFTLYKITSAADLTAKLKTFTSIATIDYFGHSNPNAMFLEYSSLEDSVSKDYWQASDAPTIKPSQFTKSAVFASYGCNQGDAGALAEKLREVWRIRTIGSRGKTDFEITGPFGGPTFPTSAGGYVEYPAPAVDDKGQLVRPLPAANALTYSKTSPPS